MLHVRMKNDHLGIVDDPVRFDVPDHPVDDPQGQQVGRCQKL